MTRIRTLQVSLVSVAMPVLLSIVPLSSAAASDLTVAADPVAVSPYSVVNHNAEKKMSAINAAVTKALAEDAKVLLLQEVCEDDLAGLKLQHGVGTADPWTFSVHRSFKSSNCTNADGTKHFDTNVAIYLGGAGAQTYSYTFQSAQRTADSYAGAACVFWNEFGLSNRACSLHMPSEGTPDGQTPALTGEQIRNRQLQEFTENVVNPWVNQDRVVILGGDFNTPPKRVNGDLPSDINRVYSHLGTGRFRELSSQNGADCRCGADTTDSADKGKIDYIFFSTNRLAASAVRSMQAINTVSDHNMLSGYAEVKIS